MHQKEKERPDRSTTSTISDFLRKISLKHQHGLSPKIIDSNSTFKLVVKSRFPEMIVGFTLANLPPTYMLSYGKSEEMVAEKLNQYDQKYWDRCTFHLCANLWFEGYGAFESIKEASRYIVYQNNKFMMKKYNGTERFKQDASFVFTTAPKGYSSSNPEDKNIPQRRVTFPSSRDGVIGQQKKFSLNEQCKKKTKRENPFGENRTIYMLQYSACSGCLNFKQYSGIAQQSKEEET